ncbi:hypothetical protein HK413_10165 [Mucilaginibacter sp. S1162]|uniref:Uncharacterized protein n=1 Tax=Mucilaginibacter humi TaxID=2732510 RepID=A0ABX1W2E6_9SPHI|nr:hypothetical protein [Mucilaginibacter humi]NNU34404.1 hypothetical protein [Mucilaginibacter humi]
MKKISLSMLAILFAATSLMANVKVPVKKAKAKQATCTSCPKGQKCTKEKCADLSSCCK